MMSPRTLWKPFADERVLECADIVMDGDYVSRLAPLFPFSFGLWIFHPTNPTYLLYCLPYIALSTISARWMVENLTRKPLTDTRVRSEWKLRIRGRISAAIVRT